VSLHIKSGEICDGLTIDIFLVMLVLKWSACSLLLNNTFMVEEPPLYHAFTKSEKKFLYLLSTPNLKVKNIMFWI
jgi:hypothetical protein